MKNSAGISATSGSTGTEMLLTRIVVVEMLGSNLLRHGKSQSEVHDSWKSHLTPLGISIIQKKIFDAKNKG
jgi:hypothetical protein